ncbi:MAG: RNA polymerase factor sigma-54 [Spirochaetota bacterium]|nr:MAG: RNA polymerase factor sigma-54 [Spirochaetota bacterium]
MEIKPVLDLKQTQRLVMTPQLQQAIELLQLSNMELSERIEEELEMNPALELDDSDNERELTLEEIKDVSSDTNEDELYDENEISEVYEGDYYYENKSYSHIEEPYLQDKKREFIEGTVSREETLKEYLLWQVRLLKLSEEELSICELLIGYIDIMGYLSVSLESIASDSGYLMEGLQKALKTIQGLDPPGVGARDIKECLLIQLKNRGSYPLAEKIIINNLNEIKLKRFEEVSKHHKIPVSEVKEAFAVISSLEPYPGRQFYSGEIKYIIPDVIIEETEEGFEAIPNNSFIPKLKVNNYFENLARRKGSDKKIKGFVKEKVQRAKNFMYWIEQRESTLLRVTRAILEEQIDFFKHGPKYLKPLVLKDIAVKLDLHESTISRITSSKYVQTPFGVFQLKYFFSNTIPADGSKEYSSRSIKEMIKDIVNDKVLKHQPSDQKIADMLLEKGIKIARRTVAKYRKELNILPSNLRRKQ